MAENEFGTVTSSSASLPPGWVEQTQIMLNSYRHWTGRELIPRIGSAEQQAMALARCRQFLGEPAADLVEDQADERLGAVDVGGRHDEIEGRRFPGADDVADAPVAPPCHLGHDRIAVEAEEGHGRGDRKSTRLNSSHIPLSRMPSSA